MQLQAWLMLGILVVMPFAMILMVAASCAFINPAGFQTNLMVQGPLGYRFNDFAKVGLPLTVIVGIVVLVLAPIVYGFQVRTFLHSIKSAVENVRNQSGDRDVTLRTLNVIVDRIPNQAFNLRGEWGGPNPSRCAYR